MCQKHSKYNTKVRAFVYTVMGVMAGVQLFLDISFFMKFSDKAYV